MGADRATVSGLSCCGYSFVLNRNQPLPFFYTLKEWRAMDIEESLYYERVDELMRQIQTLKEELVYEKEQRDQVLRDSYFKTGKDSFVNGEDNVRGES